MFAQDDGACDDAGSVDVESDNPSPHRCHAVGKQLPNADLEPELFGDFAGEGDGGGFAGFDFAAREFPFAGEGAVGAALRDEAAVALGDGGADDVEGRHGGASVAAAAVRSLAVEWNDGAE